MLEEDGSDLQSEAGDYQFEGQMDADLLQFDNVNYNQLEVGCSSGNRTESSIRDDEQAALSFDGSSEGAPVPYLDFHGRVRR